MKMFRVSVAAVKTTQWWNYPTEYNVWAKDQEQAEQAVYDKYRRVGLVVGRKRITSRTYAPRKPIIRMVT